MAGFYKEHYIKKSEINLNLFNVGEQVVTKKGIATILDFWYATTNLWCDVEYKLFTPNGIEYIRQKDIITKV